MRLSYYNDAQLSCRQGKCQVLLLVPLELLEQARDASASFGRAVLADKHGCDAAHAANAESSNDSPCIDLADGVVGSGLDRRSDKEDKTEEHEREAAAEPVVDKRRGNGAEETASRQERDDVGGDLGIFGRSEPALVCRKAEILFEA